MSTIATASDTNERKEEKIATARQKLKQFKKDTKQQHQYQQQQFDMVAPHMTSPVVNYTNGMAPTMMYTNSNENFHNTVDYLNQLGHSEFGLMTNGVASTNSAVSDLTDRQSGRSTPSSTSSSLRNGSQRFLPQPTHLSHSPNVHSTNVQQPPALATSSPTTNNNNINYKEQLQLHVQTIGILVAEKAELQSKLQQQTKKCDKKQDECDELMGRLKASRLKINDLERLINQLSAQQQQQQQHKSANLNGDGIGTGTDGSGAGGSDHEAVIDKLRTELNTNQLLIDELRMRLNESNEKLLYKQQETQKLAQLTLDLKSQLEMMQLRFTQMTAASPPTTNGVHRHTVSENGHRHDGGDNDDDNESTATAAMVAQDEWRDQVAALQRQLAEKSGQVESQAERLKQEYQTYVDQLQRQVESLVDQINRMSDEREDAFAKIDRLEALLKSTTTNAQRLSDELTDAKKQQQQQQAASEDQQQHQSTAVDGSSSNSNNKVQLLENEIKYFKQQIEILLDEQRALRHVIEERELSLANLGKLVDNYEAERDQYARLLEQSHADKQTISRILSQNKELKEQLAELQDAYVLVTKQNLDLTTQLQAEQFKVSQQQQQTQQQQQPEKVDEHHQQQQLKEDVEQKKSVTNVLQQSAMAPISSSDWGDDIDGDTPTDGAPESQPKLTNSQIGEPTLMDSVKQRIEYLERENKDLNDYIELVNKQLTEKQEQDKQVLLYKRHLNVSTDPMTKTTTTTTTPATVAATAAATLQQAAQLTDQIKQLELEKSELIGQLALCQQTTDDAGNLRSDQQEGQQQQHQQLIHIEMSQQHLNNMKLLEEKFNKVMKDNADLREKNQELEHVIQQLQFETETIIDYISMYQMERLKLNEKYKIKDETIRSLSTQLQVNKLALYEIYNYMSAYTRIVVKQQQQPQHQIQQQNPENQQDAETAPVKESSSAPLEIGDDAATAESAPMVTTTGAVIASSNVAESESEQKKLYLMGRIEQLLNELTSRTTNTLNKVAHEHFRENENSTAHQSQQHHPHAGQQELSQMDAQGIAEFKLQTAICSNCYGDLFVV